jgi:hypothetical protein
MTWHDPVVRYGARSAVYPATGAARETQIASSLRTLPHDRIRVLAHTMAGSYPVAGYTGLTTWS